MPEPRGWLVRSITELGAEWAFWPRRFNLSLEEDEDALPKDLSRWEVQAVYTHHPYAELKGAVEKLLDEYKSCMITLPPLITIAIEDIHHTLKELENE